MIGAHSDKSISISLLTSSPQYLYFRNTHNNFGKPRSSVGVQIMEAAAKETLL